MLSDATFLIHCTGDWKPGHVRVAWSPGTRRIEPHVEQEIDRAWAAASARLGANLFDGPMCRLEHWAASPAELLLSFSRTSYRIFLGTNLMNSDFADQWGDEILANPVGASTVLETADGWLMLGRRNQSVAYYPSRVHPFAGALEPNDPLDVFDEVRRELREELSMDSRDTAELRCLGIAMDKNLRQPELIFHARSALTRMQTEAMLDPAEHIAVFPVRAAEFDVRQAMDEPVLTPVARAALSMWLQATGSAFS